MKQRIRLVIMVIIGLISLFHGLFVCCALRQYWTFWISRQSLL